MRTYTTKTPYGKIAVNQPPINGYDISYNPDDRRWYVAQIVRGDELEFIANFADRRNAIQYAKTH